MSFTKGYTYLAQKDSKWYIVHQSGQRSWTATVFTHTVPVEEEAILTGNGKDLPNKFGEKFTYRIGRDGEQARMRKDMFNILKWGQRTEPKPEIQQKELAT